MAGTAIGRAALVFTSQTSQATQGMDSLYGGIQGFKSKVTGSFQTLNLGSMFSGLGAAGRFLGPVGVGIAAVAGGAKILGDAVDSVKELAAIGQKAKSLGVATDQFMGLSEAVKKVGVDSNQFGSLLAKMTGKIATGGQETANALGSIGIRMQDIKGISADRQFLTIADALQKIPNAGKRAAAEMKLFEEAGIALDPVLRQGGAALDQFIDKQKAMGTALGGEDMAAIQKAKDAIPKIEAVFKGLWNKTVVAMAPFIEAIGNAATKIFTALVPAFDWVARAARGWFAVIGPAVQLVIDVIGEVVTEVREWIAATFDLGGEWVSIQEVISTALEVIAIAGTFVWDTLRAGAGIVAVGISLLVRAFGEVIEAMGRLIKLGSKLPDALGGKQFQEAGQWVEGLGKKTNDAAKGMQTWGENQVTGFGNSADKVQGWFAKLREGTKEAVEEGMDEAVVAGDVETGVQKSVAGKANSAIIAGSKEDLSARARFAESNTADPALDVAKQQLGIQKATLTAVKDLPRNIKPVVFDSV